MPAVRCETCKGTGIVTETKYELDSIGKVLFPEADKFKCGMTVERAEQYRSHLQQVSHKTTCPNCGGSGCKWQDEDKQNG